MAIDTFLFKIILLTIPGFISLLIIKRLAVFRRDKKELKTLNDYLFVLLLSIACSFIYDFIFFVISKSSNIVHDRVSDKIINGIQFSIEEIIWLSFVGIILGVLISIVINKKIIQRLLKILNITNHYGDDDVWTFVCNSENTNWVFVRDHKLDLVYYGLLEQYSDPGESRELLLSNVSVYENHGAKTKLLYEAEKLYISRNNEDITLELVIPKEEADGKR